METQQSTTDLALAPQSTNGNHHEHEVSISYEEYKALESGFLEEKRKLEDRMWLDSNMSRFDEILRQNYDSSIRRFSEKVITYIAKATGAVYGAFFTVDFETHTINATGGYACTVETMERTKFNFGEGLVGQVAKSKEIMSLDNVETQLDSSLGRISACFLTIAPLIFNDKVYGIIELTTLSKLKPRNFTLLERMTQSIAAVLQSLLNNQRTKELLIESLQQTEESKKRDETLQSLREQLQRKEDELQKLIGNIQTTETGITAETFTNLHAELLNAQDELAQIRQAWQTQQTNIAQFAQIQQEHAAQTEKINQQDDQIKNLTDSLHWKHEEIERQSKVLQDRKAEFENIQNALVEKETENKKFLEEIIRQEKTLQQLHAQLKDTLSQAQVPAEIAELKDLLQQKETLYAQLQQALELERINYVEQVESMQKASAEIENLEQQWSVQTQIWQVWQETAKEREEEFKTLKGEFDKEVAFGQKIEAELNTLKHQVLQKDTEINTLKAQAETFTQIQAEIVALKDEILQKDTELHALKAQVETINQETLAQMQQEISKRNAELQDLQNRYAKKEDEHLVTQYMLHQMQANPLVTRETERLTKEIELKDLEIKRLQNKIPTQTDGAEVSSEILSQVTEQAETIDQLKDELQRYTQAYEDLNKSFEETSEALENTKKQLEETAEAPEISSLVAEIREKETLVKDLQQKLSAYDTPDSYIAKQYEHIQQKIKDLEIVQQHLADKEAELNYLKEALETEKTTISQTTAEQNIQLQNQIDFKQEEVQKREAELSTLFNKINTAFAMLEVDMEGRILSANNKLLFILGLASEEMVLEELQKFLKPEFVESNAYKQMWNELAKVGATQIVEEFTMIGRKEREVKMNVTFVPILDGAGKPYQIIQVVNFINPEDTGYKKMIYGNDFTELAEEANQNIPTETENETEITTPVAVVENLDFDEEKEIFKAIQSSFMLLELDTQGKITTANHQIALCLGYDEAELVGKAHADLLHEDEQDGENYQDILAHLSEGHYATEVLTYIGKEKEKIKLRSYFNPLKDKDEKTRKVLVMSQYMH